jgi:3-hydroxy-9,10-secoandrosta-1,3,5(10)-triene-9,17-dione monooxygenase
MFPGVFVTISRDKTSPSIEADIVAAAASLAPALRSRTAETDKLAKLPDATINDLESARLFDMMVPKIYGGLQCSIRTLTDAVVQLGQGDGSVAWVVALRAAATWMLMTSYPKDVVDEIYATSGKFRVAGVLGPRSVVKTRRVEGGVVIEDGTWGFNSGVPHAEWDVLGIPILDDAGQVVGRGSALIPISQVTLLNDWDTIGLRGSGSTSVSVKDVFVPDKRIALLRNSLRDDYAGTHLGEVPLYRTPFVPFFATNLVFPALGMAKAVLDLFAKGTARRGIAFMSYEKQDEAAVTHVQIGTASARIDAAEAVLRRSIDSLETTTASGTPMPLEQRIRIWRDAGFASQLIWEAVDLMAGASGSAIVNVDNPMSRLWRDVRVAGLHGAICTSTTMELFGGVLLGKKLKTPLAWSMDDK